MALIFRSCIILATWAAIYFLITNILDNGLHTQETIYNDLFSYAESSIKDENSKRQERMDNLTLGKGVFIDSDGYSYKIIGIHQEDTKPTLVYVIDEDQLLRVFNESEGTVEDFSTINKVGSDSN